MPNYCCVPDCGRNSKTHSLLTFFVFPKDRKCQLEWLNNIKRNSLNKKDAQKLGSYRVCSRHFEPSLINKRSLKCNAVPTLNLPGSNEETFVEEEDLSHEDVVCDSCSVQIQGFRYKCVTCLNYDLCQKCEMHRIHQHHYMLRIPTAEKSKSIKKLNKKWQKVLKFITDTSDLESDGSNSSDDEPITKYSKNYDSGIEIDEDVKAKIRKEVERVIQVCNKRKQGNKRLPEENTEKAKKKRKNDDKVPIVAFADVNDVTDGQIEIKIEKEISTAETSQENNILNSRLGEELSEFMIFN